MEMKVDERVVLYSEIYKKLYEAVSETNPEHAVEIALGIFSEIAKDLRTEQIAQLKIKTKADETPKELATEKQRQALHKFGVKRIPEDLSKEEASEALDLLISFSKAGESESISRIVEELNRRWAESISKQKSS